MVKSGPLPRLAAPRQSQRPGTTPDEPARLVHSRLRQGVKTTNKRPCRRRSCLRLERAFWGNMATVRAALKTVWQNAKLFDALRVPSQKVTWTYDELGRYSRALATGLVQHDVVGSGRRVGLFVSPTVAEAVVTVLGAAQAGATLVDLGHLSNASSKDIAHACKELGVTLAILPKANSVEQSEMSADSKTSYLHIEPKGRSPGTQRFKDILVYGPFPAGFSPLDRRTSHLSALSPLLLDVQSGKEIADGDVLGLANALAEKLNKAAPGHLRVLVESTEGPVAAGASSFLPRSLAVVLAGKEIVLGENEGCAIQLGGSKSASGLKHIV